MYFLYSSHIIFFLVPKDVRLNSIHYLIMKIHSKREVESIAVNHLADITKPAMVKQAKFEYSSFGKIFNKGFKEEDKQHGLLQRLSNIEGKNKEQLKAIKYQREDQLKKITRLNKIKIPLLKPIRKEGIKNENLATEKSIRLFKRLENMEVKDIHYEKLYYKSGDDVLNFGAYGSLGSP